MTCVRVLVQECKPGTVEMLTHEAEETFVPQLRAIPGFVSYQVAKIDDRSLVAIGWFETRDAAEAMERIAVEWRQEYGKDAIVSVRPYIGEVILDAGPGARPSVVEAHPIH